MDGRGGVGGGVVRVWIGVKSYSSPRKHEIARDPSFSVGIIIIYAEGAVLQRCVA